MWLLELACVAIVSLYVTVRLQRAPNRAAVAGRLGLLVFAAWAGEDSVIRAYHFYSYSPRWHLFVDQVPIMIVLIWPVVIDSAWRLAERVARRRVALAAAGFVLMDAALIEPIAVQSGLWQWSKPGMFAVPPIGILGWALFTWAVVWLLPRTGRLTVLLAPMVTHVLLLSCWWGGLRHVSTTLDPWWVVAMAWLVLLPLAYYFRTTGARARVPVIDLMVRLPGAIFFFVLLLVTGQNLLMLGAYTLAFVAPYLALIRGAEASHAKKSVRYGPQLLGRESN
jgi:hypothetical protein